MPTAAFAVAATVAVLVLGSAPAAAQGCAADGERPRVCSIRLFGTITGERPVELDPRQPISLPAGAEVALEIYAYDQYGRDFPRERLHFGVDGGYDCQRVLELEQLDGNRGLSIRAGAGQGRCEARLWLAGNLNLEWPLQLEVAPRARTGYSRTEAEFLTTKLYEALLGRAPDAAGLAGRTAEIQRGNLALVIDGLLRSAEFQSQRSSSTPAEMLERIYRSLLGRPPDTPAVLAHLGQAERGDYGSILWALIRSEEFERRILEAASPE